VIIFQEGTPYNPVNVDFFGTVPQIFCVVQPVKPNEPYYRLGFLTRVNIKPFGPEVPRDQVFDAKATKDFILTKLANGKVMTNQCPPLNRLYYVPRAATIDDIAIKYPHESKKEAKAREHEEAKKRTVMRQSSFDSRQQLKVWVTAGRNLPSKDLNGLSDPYAIIKIKEQVYKTNIIRYTLNPTWNELFVFDLLGLDLTYTDIKIKLKDYDRIGGHDPMGFVRIPLNEVEKYDTDTWFPLGKKKHHMYTVAGDICLRFEIFNAAIPVNDKRGSLSDKDRLIIDSARGSFISEGTGLLNFGTEH